MELDQIPPNFECKFIDNEGAVKDMLCSLAAIPGSDKSVVSLADITELKEAERQIYHQAFHDTLTNLPNRALFMEHLGMAVKRTKRRDDYHFAVLYLDIDRFKLVNDSLGHNLGDKLLVAFANRIKKSLREIDSLARLGGDEFVILLEDIENDKFASYVAERLQQELKRPFMVSGKEVFAPASFGVVSNTKDYVNAENIIRDADALDALGSVGIMRAFTSKYFLPEYDPNNIRGETWGLSSEEFRESFGEGLGVVKYIIDQINQQIRYYDNLHTRTARQIAKPFVKFMKDFVLQLELEIGNRYAR